MTAAERRGRAVGEAGWSDYNGGMHRLFSTRIRVLWAAAVLLLVAVPAARLRAARRGVLTLTVHDKATGRPLAARMHLRNARGRPVLPKGTIRWKDHFVFDGTVRLELRPGRYTFELEHGPEYRLFSGHFTLEDKADEARTVELERFVDMADEGWWSGDLHIHRKPEEMELLVRAEDLHVAPLITWWNRRNQWADRSLPDPLRVEFRGRRWVHWMAGEDEREGGALLYFNLPRPLPIAAAGGEFPCSAAFLAQARRIDSVHVDIEKPFWWDVPLWLATGQVDSIGLAHNHFWRDRMLDNEAWGKPRDKKRYRSPFGTAWWSFDIYYHVLNSGIRLPPSAGSASGVHPNPVGYNRVYVHCDDFSYDNWFNNLRAGQVVVTNGPMLRVRASGELPGHVFYGTAGEELELPITMKLSTREKIAYVEIIKNGVVDQRVALRKPHRKSPVVRFRESGWFLVRVVGDHPKTLRFASTGPFYVEFEGKPRISRASCRFFLDWLTERARRLPREPADEFQKIIPYYRQARDFWRKRLSDATVD